MPRRLGNEKEKRAFERRRSVAFGSTNILESLHALEIARPYSIRCKVVYHGEDIDPDSIPFGRKHIDFDFSPHQKAERSYMFRTTRQSSDRPPIKMPFAMFKHGESRSRMIVSACTRDEWKTLRRFLKKQYPTVIEVFLTQLQIMKLIERLHAHVGPALRIRSYTAKEAIDESTRKHTKSVREWTNEPFEEAFRTIKERSQFITAVDLEFKTDARTQNMPPELTHCKIRRCGEIEVMGDFLFVFEWAIAEIIRIADQKLKFFHARGLRQSNYKARPIAIQYDTEVFAEVAGIRRLVDTLKLYKNSMHSVVHGNPYAHVKLTDTMDGSSFDVWALSASEIALVPGLRASEAAFERLINHVFETFQEGSIAAYEHK